jgi:Flp pilus assembly protein TadG
MIRGNDSNASDLKQLHNQSSAVSGQTVDREHASPSGALFCIRRNEDGLVEKTIADPAKPPKPHQGLLTRFARNRRGVAALEFGMVSIPFLGLLCAIFETAFVYYNQELFDKAVADAARQILVNAYPSGGSTPLTPSTFVTTVGGNGYSLCNALPAYFQGSSGTCPNVLVNVTASAAGGTFASMSSSINMTTLLSSNQSLSSNMNLGSPGSIVVFQAFYPMPIYLSVLMSSGPHGNQATNLYSQVSNSVVTNPVTNSGLVHAIYSVKVFRNEP